MSSDRYASCVARIRALEAKLLSPSDVDRIVRADLSGLGAVLQELRLVPEGTDAGDAVALDLALEARLEETLDLLRRMMPDPELMDLFQLRRDLRNVGRVLKTRAAGQSADELHFDKNGVFLAEDLKQNILSGRLEMLPDPVKEMTRAALAAAEASDEPLAAIGYALDRGYLAHCLDTARRYGGVWFIEWAKRRIDVHNLDAFLRTKAQGLPQLAWEEIAAEGGTLALFDFRIFWPEPLEAFAEKLQFTVYGPAFADGVAGWKEHGDLIDWERLSADQELGSLVGTRYEPGFSAGPALLYWLRREAETRLVRTVAAAKRLNRSSEEIRRMVARTDA